jgi:hypothetical protein
VALQTEHVFSYFVGTEVTPIPLGELPEGFRVTVVNDVLKVAGPRITGTMLPGGGDWMTVRRDGIALLDVRNIIETEDGARILYRYGGIGELGPDGYERMRSGQPPQGILWGAPVMSTGDSRYAWCNRRQFVVRGEIVPGEVTEMRVYALG